MSEPLEIITTATGYFKPGLRGRIVGGAGSRTVFLGPDCALVESKVPEFSVLIEGVRSPRQFCQYGRDFVFATPAAPVAV